MADAPAYLSSQCDFPRSLVKTREDDIFAMFVKRIKVQVLQLQAFVEHLVQKLLGHRQHHSIISKNDAVDSMDDEDSHEDKLMKDAFSLHKMIVAVTAAGKDDGNMETGSRD